jgi:hypothetical protein
MRFWTSVSVQREGGSGRNLYHPSSRHSHMSIRGATGCVVCANGLWAPYRYPDDTATEVIVNDIARERGWSSSQACNVSCRPGAQPQAQADAIGTGCNETRGPGGRLVANRRLVCSVMSGSGMARR